MNSKHRQILRQMESSANDIVDVHQSSIEWPRDTFSASIDIYFSDRRLVAQCSSTGQNGAFSPFVDTGITWIARNSCVVGGGVAIALNP